MNNPTTARIEAIREWIKSQPVPGISTNTESASIGYIRMLLAEIDRLTADRDEARAQQAHTASCNIELMRKLDAKDSEFNAQVSEMNEGVLENFTVLLDQNRQLSEALRLLLSEAGRTVDLSVDWSPDTAVSLVLHWGTIQKARKALGGREVMSLQRTY